MRRARHRYRDGRELGLSRWDALMLTLFWSLWR